MISVIDLIVPFLHVKHISDSDSEGLDNWTYILKFPPTKN